MRRFGTPLLVLGCLTALTFACYGSAIVRGEQFGYRDAAHFYYPLYERVQQGWRTGHWPPLWEPEENAGMPLLGNPTAAVLYPGKLIFAILPYPVGARVYVIAHTLLAFATMLVLLRSWATSWTGSTLSALAYAFGAPILFQYCNIIYLVGAAWVPLGFHALDRWLRLGKRGAILELSVVLALEVLGGDPESAYLTGLCAGGYAAMLAWSRRKPPSLDRESGWFGVLKALPLLVIWVVATLAIAHWASVVRPPRVGNNPPSPLPWMSGVGPTIAALWGLAGVSLVSRWWKGRRGGPPASPLAPMLAGLAASAVLAVLLAAVQLFPVGEFTAQTTRASADGPHDVFPFSLDPFRVVEFVWPNLFGTPFRGNRSWLGSLSTAKVWVPTLYLGGLTIVLALGALRLRRTPVWRSWLSWIAVVSLVLSFGEYGGPLYWARYSKAVSDQVGPHDKVDDASLRVDRHLRDGDGGPYWLLATVLPGFRQFRFPSKLLTFTALALAALAGQGWDALLQGDRRQRRRSTAWAGGLLGLTVVTLAVTTARRPDVIAWLEARKQGSPFGPLDARGAFAEMRWGLIHGAVILAVAVTLLLRGSRRPALASAVALIVMTVDLASANARYVLTVPQSLFETNPEVLKVIQDAEAKDPSPGPYRVHRMPVWNLFSWLDSSSDERVREFVAWERDTIQPKYGIPLGVHYTLTAGVAELYDYEWYFNGYTRLPDEEVVKRLGVDPKDRVVAFPRRAFDLWTTRYFVLPFYANHWVDEHRGFASFLQDTRRIYPPRDAFGPDRTEKEREWVLSHDVQVMRNLTPYPRAWVVHSARPVKAVRGLDRAAREKPMMEILFSNDYLWRDPDRIVYDPKVVAWVEEDDLGLAGRSLSNRSPGQDEKATIRRYEAERVEIEATLDSPGLVVLADIYYPGWELTIDGLPAPIYRVNRLMRGAAVPAGEHRLVYTYRPMSYRAGLVCSCVGLVLLSGLSVVFKFKPFVAGFADDGSLPTGAAGS